MSDKKIVPDFSGLFREKILECYFGSFSSGIFPEKSRENREIGKSTSTKPECNTMCMYRNHSYKCVIPKNGPPSMQFGPQMNWTKNIYSAKTRLNWIKNITFLDSTIVYSETEKIRHPPAHIN